MSQIEFQKMVNEINNALWFEKNEKQINKESNEFLNNPENFNDLYKYTWYEKILKFFKIID